MEIEFTVRILPGEYRQQLYASIGFALSFILLFVLLGLYFLPILGLFILIGGFAGYMSFKPFFKLHAQKKCPDRLQITHDYLVYFTNGKRALSLPISAILRTEYKEGIIIYLKKPVSERIDIVDRKLLKPLKRGDFYLEWFEPKAFDLVQSELNDIVHPNQPNQFPPI